MAFTIKELESLSGIKAHTIRIWEQRYHFLRPERTQTNIRTYNNDELKILLTVALLNKYGYKISRIDEMQPEQRANAVLRLPQPEAYKEHIINRLLGYMVDFKNGAFEDALNEYIGKHGIEETVSTIIFGFFGKSRSSLANQQDHSGPGTHRVQYHPAENRHGHRQPAFRTKAKTTFFTPAARKRIP